MLLLAVCSPLQTVIATPVGRKATPVGRTLGWGCACANPTSRGHTATSALQATMDPAASVSDSGLASSSLPLLASLLGRNLPLPILCLCWGGGILRPYFQVTNSQDFCRYFPPSPSPPVSIQPGGALEKFRRGVSCGLGMLTVSRVPCGVCSDCISTPEERAVWFLS